MVVGRGSWVVGRFFRELVCVDQFTDELAKESSYSKEANDPLKHLFQGLFETNLARRELLTVLRFEPVVCECGTLLDLAVMRKRLNQGKDFTFCEECAAKLVLSPADEPIQLTQEVSQQVSVENRASDKRAVFEEMVYKLKSKADIIPDNHGSRALAPQMR